MKAHQTLVAYFSATGTTAKAAQSIADITGGTLHEIAPQTAYTNADLDWHDKQSRSSVEMGDTNARPALKEAKTDLSGYDVVFIGYPIWWDEAPRIINTFIENNDLKGKTLICYVRRQQHHQQCESIATDLSRPELERRKITEPDKHRKHPKMD